MTNLNRKIPTKEDIVETPRNKTIEVVITNVDIKTWEEIITDPETLKKFKNPKADQLIIYYENAAEGIKGNENFGFFEKPTDASKLGRFLKVYDRAEVGVKIQVYFDIEGKSSILIAKK